MSGSTMPVPLYRGTPVCFDNDAWTALRPTNIPFPRKCEMLSTMLFNGTAIISKHRNEERYEESQICEADIHAQIPEAPHAPAALRLAFFRPQMQKAQLDFAHEVMTLHYLREQHMFPVPIVYAYCTNKACLDEQFIVMGHGDGVPLDEVWSQLSDQGKEHFVSSLAGLVFRLSLVKTEGVGGLLWSRHGHLSLGMLSRLAERREREESVTRKAPPTRSFSDKEGYNPETVSPFVQSAQAMAPLITGVLALFEPASTPYCLVPGPHTLTARSIMVKADGPLAGQITAIRNWEGINFLPMWMLAKNLNNTLGAQFADWDNKFHEDVNKLYLSMEGRRIATLMDLLAPEYDILREMVDAIQSGSYEQIDQWYERHKPEYDRRYNEAGKSPEHFWWALPAREAGLWLSDRSGAGEDIWPGTSSDADHFEPDCRTINPTAPHDTYEPRRERDRRSTVEEQTLLARTSTTQPFALGTKTRLWQHVSYNAILPLPMPI
ncbi:hypothetical protein CALVIDRAFT_586822 [Calocera viscosa TUFC12733]|uniref:Aminoglycoside phosphotransferase domain-containing protein n=1 Tax=Calocera viscosa (strain TUFC12733) TaxID=1330018 RepID=A0A167HUX5_CALVF|nr:hypothetical protein CALVIDRAFT_586822 [Calocera viscosa TUFC12733]